VPVFKLPFAGLALGLRPRFKVLKDEIGASALRRRDPLPPILALEGDPDRTIRTVIDETAARLGVTVSTFDRLSSLARDPDLGAVMAVVLTRPRGQQDLALAMEQARTLMGARPVVVLAPQPLSPASHAVMPLDPCFVAPPLSADRLLFALDLAPTSQT